MGSQAQLPRSGTRKIFREDETEEKVPEQYFCAEIRDFKNLSRSFHDFYAEAEGAHNPRSFDRGCKDILETAVTDACHYPKRYESKEKSLIPATVNFKMIIDRILSVSEKMVGKNGKVNLEVVLLTMYVYNSKEVNVVPLFKIYGNSRKDFIFISKNGRTYTSLNAFLDDNDLPHSLVCAAREGSTKTYEIDRTIQKYPLVFFTVNRWKFIDRREEHARLWSTTLSNTIILDLPFLMVQAFFRHIHIEVKYFMSAVNYNRIMSGSVKEKFFKFVEANMNLIPCFGTIVNGTIVMGVAYAVNMGLCTNEELSKTLLLNGNVFTRYGMEYLQLNTKSPLTSNAADLVFSALQNSFPGYFPGREYYFTELTSEFNKGKVDPETVIACSNIIEELCDLGIKSVCAFGQQSVSAEKPLQNLALLGLKVMIRLLPYLFRKLSQKSKPRNSMDIGAWNTVVKPDNGDYSLDRFLQTVCTEDDIVNLFPDEKSARRSFEGVCRECAADESQFIFINEDKSLFISLAPISTVMENLLEDSRTNARVYASEDDSFYEIASREALYKIYPFKNNKSDLEIQYIYVERR